MLRMPNCIELGVPMPLCQQHAAPATTDVEALNSTLEAERRGDSPVPSRKLNRARKGGCRGIERITHPNPLPTADLGECHYEPLMPGNAHAKGNQNSILEQRITTNPQQCSRRRMQGRGMRCTRRAANDGHAPNPFGRWLGVLVTIWGVWALFGYSLVFLRPVWLHFGFWGAFGRKFGFLTIVAWRKISSGCESGTVVPLLTSAASASCSPRTVGDGAAPWATWFGWTPATLGRPP